MRIESINIINFRQLRRLSLRFDRIRGKKDLHIILANNGVGKTNILNAITWCLYHDEMHIRDKATATTMINTTLVDEVRKRGGGTETVSVELKFKTENENDRIIFERTADFNISEDEVMLVIDQFKIKYLNNGEWRVITSEEERAEILHRFIPESINNYILFDGEQLEKFFAANQLENVRTGINELTQASFLEKASKSVSDYIRSHLNPKLANSKDSEIQAKQIKLDELQDIIDECEKNILIIEDQIKKCDTEILENDIIIHGCEVVKDKAEEQKNIEPQIEEKEKLLSEKTKELTLFTRKCYQSIALVDTMLEFSNYLHEQDVKGKLPPRIDKGILQEIIKSNHCPICDSRVLSLDYVKGLENSLEIATTTSGILNKCIGTLESYSSEIDGYTLKKENLFRECKTIQDELKKLEDRHTKIEQYLRNFVDFESITNAVEEKEAYRKQRDDQLLKLGAENVRKKGVVQEYAETDKELQRLLIRNKELESVKNQIDYLKKCIRIMNETRSEILVECRQAIQSETFRIFCELLWKKEEFSGVEILEDYHFILRDVYGNQALGSCSAAETALLALSFTLALQETSQHDSLLFIDTPLGRVDQENRENFIKTLLKVANRKQVILTFTPTEYDTTVMSLINNEYSSFNHLQQVEGSTILTND